MSIIIPPKQEGHKNKIFPIPEFCHRDFSSWLSFLEFLLPCVYHMAPYYRLLFRFGFNRFDQDFLSRENLRQKTLTSLIVLVRNINGESMCVSQHSWYRTSTKIWGTLSSIIPITLCLLTGMVKRNSSVVLWLFLHISSSARWMLWGIALVQEKCITHCRKVSLSTVGS